MTVRPVLLKLAPPSVMLVDAVAFRLDKDPLEITKPGLAELPRTRLKSRPVPKFNPALP